MKSIFLSHKQVFESPLPLFRASAKTAAATDLALLTVPDDGFALHDGDISWYLADGMCVDRGGREEPAGVCAVRPVLELGPGEASLLKGIRETAGIAAAEFGAYPMTILDPTLRDMAEKEYKDGTLPLTDLTFTVAGPDGLEKLPVYRLGAKQIVRVTANEDNVSGYVQLSDGTALSAGSEVFLEVRPVRWYYDAANHLLICGRALFAGMEFEEAKRYLAERFLEELTAVDEKTAAEEEAAGAEESGQKKPFHIGAHDELALIRAYVEADIPVFIHGLAGDGKSDRIRQIDPQALDIELVNETPETINGRAIYNETKDEIIDVKPTWLVKMERLCEDGETHILFFDELTNATKQTQSVIFKIVLERVVNNRWPLPPNARIVAAGNDRSESTVSHDLAEPLFGRFAHIYIRTTVENWMPWAVGEGINPYVMEFLANNDLYLRTAYTGTEGYADPRRWEMVSRVLDHSGNDFALLEPIVGHETAEAFIRFFKAQEQLKDLGTYTDEELAHFTIARRYQLAQQCLYAADTKPEEARALVARLGAEYLAWYDYVLARKKGL